MDRRTLLQRIAGVAAVGLAGCGESPTPTPTDEPVDTPTPTPMPTDEPMDTPTPTDEPMDTPTPTETPTPTGTPTPTPTPRPEVAAEVTVAPGGDFRFTPERVEIATGETVRWTWDAGGHNVKPDDIPSDAEWEGTPGEPLDTFQEGHVYTHTFEVAGQYDYVCRPHQSLGMQGTVVVG